MQDKKRITILILILICFTFIWLSGITDFISFEKLQQNRKVLMSFVDKEYPFAVLTYLGFVFVTAFFFPGASIISALAGGFLFGVVMGMIYLMSGLILGSAIAFLLSRYLIGNWIQQKYSEKLKKFNEEIERYGSNYVIVLRICPVFPAFFINYFTGITMMPLSNFLLYTLLGTIPTSLVYCFAGRQLGRLKEIDDVFSPKIGVVIVLIMVFALLPVIKEHINRLREKHH